jgi:hypothetical protein
VVQQIGLFRKGSQQVLPIAFCGWLAWLCVFACVPMASATTLVQLTEAQMVDKSNLIIEATVLDMQAKWSPGKLAIVTLITLRVNQELLGRTAPKHVVLRCYGGTIGNQTMGLPGAPTFQKQERVLVFLHSNPHIAGEYLLTGWSQGKWSITLPTASYTSQEESSKHTTLWRAPLHGRVLKQQNGTQIQLGGPFSSQKTLYSMTQRLRHQWKQIQSKRAKQRQIVVPGRPTIKPAPRQKQVK